MQRSSSPSFILELEISFSDRLLLKQLPDSSRCLGPSFLDKKFSLANTIYNEVLGEALKRLHKVQHDREYQETAKLYGAAVDKGDTAKAKLLGKKLGEIKASYGYTEFSLHEHIAEPKHHFHDCLGIDECQKLASRAFSAVEKLRKGEAKKVSFRHWYDDTSIEGKSSNSTIKYIGNCCIQFGRGNRFPLILKKGDSYAIEALKNRVKYVRIVRKTIRGHKRYFAQLVLEGIPPRKGSLTYGNSKVGLDEGTSTIAIVSDNEVSLRELAPEVELDEKELRRINRAIDRSKRSTNPQNYNTDGTIKKGRLKWHKSNNCLKLEAKRKELYRLSAWKRKSSHNALANHIVSLGTDVRVEDMQMKALAKRSKKTSANKTNGKTNSKRRYGKVIAKRAPAMLIVAINRKLGYIGTSIKKIDTRSVKASQYDHKADSFKKKCLSDRWHIFDDGTHLQRDIYSAFLICNTTDDLTSVDRDECINAYNNFKVLHDAEIERLRSVCSKSLQWYIR